MFSQIFKRLIQTTPPTFNIGSAATAGHARGGWKLWKRLFFFVALPGVFTCALNTYLEHESKDHERPPFVEYEYLRRRNKRFPWGDGNHTLFHNPHLNALPEGYEEIDEN